MFYTAYTMPSAGRARPVTFLFNGGPGSSTMWLHMGSFGPMKVDASQPETIPGPPFRYGPNPDTLLDLTDLVFIDAPTVGLSRELGKAEPKDFFGVDKDLDAFTRTIQRYLTVYGRELNLDASGVLRENVNESEDLSGLYQRLTRG